MANYLITCPHCSQSFTANHNISSGTSSCPKCKKKYSWKIKNGALAEIKKV